MALTLGEKLRQAREERGITISEVAEQTRISSLYLECIENNEYKILPGGIFNKGFVKSYAKYVGIDEQEALRDYTALMSEQGEGGNEEHKTYRPEVLTDDQSRSTSIPTIIFALIILALLAGGIFALVRYYQDSLQNQPAANNSNSNKNGNTSNTNSNTNVSAPIPATNEIKAEFKAGAEEISLTYWIDGKPATKLLTANSSLTLDAPQNLKLSYSKYKAQTLQMTLNGKPITLPTAPANPKRNAIEFEINKENIVQILQNGAITFAAPAANTNPAPR
jgi:cytoskeletal protein RodZ